MRAPRLSFLSAFFLILGVTFAAAAIYRFASYRPTAAAVDELPDTTSETRLAAVAREPAAVSERAPAVPSHLPTNPTAAERSREQRYRELLTSPAEAPPPARPAAAQLATGTSTPARATAPKPGILTRIAAPITAALTGAGGQRGAPPAAAEVRSAEGERSGEPQKEKDPSSDSEAPRLQSVEFNPQQVQDGDELSLMAVVTDDLSGVRAVSGGISSPTGGLLGFALTREPDGNRYSARIRIPKQAPDGVWKVSYLNLTDHASNMAILNASQGGIPPSATFRVVSAASDTTPPVLRALRVEQPSMKAGERNLIHVEAEDDKSGVGTVTGVFQSPSKNARVGFGCRNTGESWTCDFLPPPTADCGEWQLEQVQLQDKANNTTWARADNPLVGRTRVNLISDRCDSEPPTLIAISIDRTLLHNIQENTVAITARVDDDVAGVESVSGQVTGPGEGQNQPRLYFSLAATPNDPKTWFGHMVVPKSAAKGIWSFASVQVIDKARNLKIYSRSDPLLTPVQFRLE
ncbi:MAG TPA: hypothetical protein VFL80_05745 [Thermoanaerobaculia bacterium]|nr:hypothetical protein [Thermoanaerobaculia bacterium]